MNDAGVGRLLVASLHQGIADLLPTRLEFYEGWLNPAGLREGRIGLAPLAAVLSFLRQEGEAYRLVVARAGEYSAEWMFAELPSFERKLVSGMPDAVPVVRALQRRLLMLAPARARMEHGQSLDAAMTSFGKSLFFRDKSMVAKLLRTWDAKGLATVAERTGRLERELMFGPAPDGPVLGEELLAIARSARGRR